MTDHYYEIHITIDPATSEPRGVMDDFQMTLADFSSGDDGVPERVLTTRRYRRDLAYVTVISAVIQLLRDGVDVLRYKVELAVVDSKQFDTLGLLDTKQCGACKGRGEVSLLYGWMTTTEFCFACLGTGRRKVNQASGTLSS